MNSALVADTVITIDRDTAIRQQNMRLLNAFRDILPAIGIESDSQKMPRHVFTVEDMMTARMIQANTIWVKQDVIGFIIGEAPNPDPYYKHGTRFLCLPPVPVTGLHAVDTQRKKTATNLADIRKELHEATITEAAVAAIYDRKEKKFKVGSSPIHLCTLLHIWESASLGHVRDYGMHAHIKSNGENLLELGPSNQEMASYDIFGNLGRLATIFGVSEKYQAILEKQG